MATKLLKTDFSLNDKHREELEEFLEKVDSTMDLFMNFDPSNPISWAITGVRVLRNTTNPAVAFDYAEDFLHSKSYFVHNLMFKFDPKTIESLKKVCKHKVVFRSKHMSSLVECFHHESLDNDFYLEITERVEYNLWIKDEEKDPVQIIELLRNVFWNDAECISLDRSWSGSHYDIYNTPFDITPYKYWGKLEEMKDRWPKYRAANIRRTALIHGRPGMGKTTFSYWLANQISKKTLVMMPEYLGSLKVRDWTTLCQIACPEMVIFQDIHLVGEDQLASFLEIFEEKPSTIPPIPYIICTANDFTDEVPEALLRPGRLGDEIYLLDEETPAAVIDDIIDNFMETMGAELDEKYRPMLHTIYLEESASLVKETIKRLLVEGPEVLDYLDIKSVEDLKKSHGQKTKKKKKPKPIVASQERG